LFSYIKGTLTELYDDVAVVECGQIGWNIHVPVRVMEMLPGIGKDVKLYTSFQVREDAMTLYGFLSRPELGMFRMLLTVNGIGARAALSILSSLSLEDLQMAILAEDGKAIAKAPGIGPKTAKRVILDLKDRIRAEDVLSGTLEAAGAVPAAAAQGTLAGDGAVREAAEALVALGYSSTEAMKAVRQVPVTENMTSEDVLKASLKYLAF